MNPTKNIVLSLGIAAALVVPAFAHGDKHSKHNEETVEWNAVPAPVQSTITSNSAGGQVVKVEKESKNGVVQYEAKVKATDGKMSEVKVGQDGKLIKVEACEGKGHGHHHEGKGEDDDKD